ncbi:hypothetical protein EA473_19975 [Natrarchaeobius chitinivorans]|uniref:Uncharacterized protein n=1 Tax=Natrarchaeobius chitinivorans TaxID=1679083 RepID=A0A3N6P5J5_NATCH|nr:hypothetical protein EA473_19975 [Natrarchaeobius chitinivorans]
MTALCDLHQTFAEREDRETVVEFWRRSTIQQCSTITSTAHHLHVPGCSRPMAVSLPGFRLSVLVAEGPELSVRKYDFRVPLVRFDVRSSLPCELEHPDAGDAVGTVRPRDGCIATREFSTGFAREVDHPLRWNRFAAPIADGISEIVIRFSSGVLTGTHSWLLRACRQWRQRESPRRSRHKACEQVRIELK